MNGGTIKLSTAELLNLSDYRTVGLSNCWTIELLDYRTVGLSNRRTIEPSDYRSDPGFLKSIWPKLSIILHKL
jgi:hypothetical protein